ncbi:hypothetical protein ILYODFUR_011584 [Ilyodon furcidens]|uniref:Uncharacterized protein n=1 Tax=Ilyodon furcidens TaxID=33524 RepID=A0ABV0SW49_9TELE
MMEQVGLFGRVDRRKAVLSENRLAAKLMVARSHMKEPRVICYNVLDVLKGDQRRNGWPYSTEPCLANTKQSTSALTPHTKHGGSLMILWACCAVVIDSHMKSSVYKHIVESKVRPSV